jgi:prepilin-type N-terminal cleavage/methylation domain-containing protein
MKLKKIQSGVSLMELTVVIAIMAILLGISLPVARDLVGSIGSEGSVRGMISAALASARATAIRDQRYAGIRFQEDTEGNQYMIFIVNDHARTGLVLGFRASEKVKPVRLPDNVGVMDRIVRIEHGPDDSDAEDLGAQGIIVDDFDNSILNRTITDTTSFSIIFSPSGKLVVQEVRVRNRDGDFRPIDTDDSSDDVFNSPVNIAVHGVGMFIQDDYADLGLGAEYSRRFFVIYNKEDFDQMGTAQKRNGYINSLDPALINPYTGKIVSRN